MCLGTRLTLASEAVSKATHGSDNVKRTVRSSIFSIEATLETKGAYIGASPVVGIS